MTKQITMPARPPKPQTAEDWIAEKETKSDKPAIKPVRMTVELDPEVHRELKIYCTMKGIWISELVRELVSRELGKSIPA